jgi:hypothetical protein
MVSYRLQRSWVPGIKDIFEQLFGKSDPLNYGKMKNELGEETKIYLEMKRVKAMSNTVKPLPFQFLYIKGRT